MPGALQVIQSHMTGSYEEAAISIALAAVHKHKQFKDIACYIKQQFDRKYPSSGKATEGVYHCVCGKRFASEGPVKHEKPPQRRRLADVPPWSCSRAQP